MILKILQDLLEFLCIDVEETLYRLASSQKVNRDIMILLNVVNKSDKIEINAHDAT